MLLGHCSLSTSLHSSVLKLKNIHAMLGNDPLLTQALRGTVHILFCVNHAHGVHTEQNGTHGVVQLAILHKVSIRMT